MAAVVLSGGVFQNRVLVAAATTAVEELGLEVWTNEKVPPNAGGISLGQAASVVTPGSWIDPGTLRSCQFRRMEVEE